MTDWSQLVITGHKTLHWVPTTLTKTVYYKSHSCFASSCALGYAILRFFHPQDAKGPLLSGEKLLSDVCLSFCCTTKWINCKYIQLIIYSCISIHAYLPLIWEHQTELPVLSSCFPLAISFTHEISLHVLFLSIHPNLLPPVSMQILFSVSQSLPLPKAHFRSEALTGLAQRGLSTTHF